MTAATPPGSAGLKAELLGALGEMQEVFADLVAAAEEKSCLRCPYMNVRRECTAAFDCINQVRVPGRERFLCSGQHRINFQK
jgi:hypothetical protein